MVVGAQHGLERNVGVGRSGYRIRLVKVESSKDVSDVASLIDEYGMIGRVAVHLETDVVIHGAVCDFECGLEVLDYSIKIGGCRGANDTVVDEDADYKVNRVGRGKSVVDTSVGITGGEVVEFKKSVECVIPQSA